MNPPFRADHVGSLLRPPGLAQARERKDLAFQQQAIREAVAKQEAIGLQSITDGEFSRDWWHLDFLAGLEGVTLRENPGPKFGGTQEQPPIPAVTGKLRYGRPIMLEDFSFPEEEPLRERRSSRSPRRRCCTCAPAAREFRARPIPIWKRSGRTPPPRIAPRSAPSLQPAAHYLQLDDVAFAYLCDPKIRDNCRT